MGKRGRPATLTTPKALALRERYATDPEYREKHKRASRESAARLRAAFDEWRSQQTCVMCGEGRGYTLDFHHVEGRDDNGGAAKSSTINSFSTDKAEFAAKCAQCVMLCANCHREAHYILATSPDTYADVIGTLPRIMALAD